MSLKPIELDGRKIPVEVTSDGWFTARYDNDSDALRAASLKELTEKLKGKLRTKKMRVKVLVTLVDKPSWRNEREWHIDDAELTGINAGNGNPIFVNQDGKVEKTDYDIVLRRLSPEEKRQLTDAIERMQTAEAEIKAMQEKWSIEPRREVEAAAARKGLEV